MEVQPVPLLHGRTSQKQFFDARLVLLLLLLKTGDVAAFLLQLIECSQSLLTNLTTAYAQFRPGNQNQTKSWKRGGGYKPQTASLKRIQPLPTLPAHPSNAAPRAGVNEGPLWKRVKTPPTDALCTSP